MSLSYPRQPNVTPHSTAKELGRRDRMCVCVCVCVEREKEREGLVGELQGGCSQSKADLGFVLYSPPLCLLSKEPPSLCFSLSVFRSMLIFTHPLWQKRKKELQSFFFPLPLLLIILGWLWSIKRHIFIICHHIHFYANEKPVPDENLFSVPQIEVSGNHVLFVFEVCL